MRKPYFLAVCLLFLALGLGWAPPAKALTWSFLTNGDQGITGTEMFVAEGRVGDSAEANHQRTFELDVGSKTASPAVTGQFVWPNGTPVAFTLTYDPASTKLLFTVADQALEYFPTTGIKGAEVLYLRTRGDEGKQFHLVLDGLTLDGHGLPPVAAPTQGLSPMILKVSGQELVDGWTLGGQATMSWQGVMPKDSHLAFQIKGCDAVQPMVAIPVPASVLLLGSGLLGLGLLGLRRRHPS